MKKTVSYFFVVAVIIFLTRGVFAQEAAIVASGLKEQTTKSWWQDNIKLKGSLWTYWIGQNHNYFAKSKHDRFVEITARLGADITLAEDLLLDLQVIGEDVRGDFNQYTVAKNNHWFVRPEFANLKLKNILGKPLTLVIGRQNLEYGDGFIVYDFTSDRRAIWTASMRSLWLGKASYELKPFTFDVFGGQTDKDYKSYEAYYKDFRTYQGRRDIVGGNIHFESEENGKWDFLFLYKDDRSLLQSDTAAISARGSVDVLKNPFTLTIQAEAVPEFGHTMVIDNSLGAEKRDREGFGVHADTILLLITSQWFRI